MKPAISIQFDENTHGVYYSGQVVSGRVEVAFSHTKKVRGILLEITGCASARFNGRNNSDARRRRRKVRYTAKEQYLATKQYLYGSENASTTELPPGKYTYSFSCQLPHSVPSSFESHYGYIRYLAKIVLDRPWKFDQKYIQGFTVLKSIDLNNESPSIRVPVTFTTSKAFLGGLFNTQSLNVRATVPQSGYVPGQTIPIKVEIENDSNIPASKVRFFLRQLISYYADTPHSNSKNDVICVARLKSAIPLAPKSTVIIEEKIAVPPVPPTSAQCSQIIRVNYEVRVDIVAFGWHPKPSVTIPIIVGTVPLIGIPQQLQSSSQTVSVQPILSQPMASTSFASPEDNDVLGANISPPSYEEAVNMQRAKFDAEEENSIQRSEFTPRYPVYESIPVIVHCTSQEMQTSHQVTEKEKIIPL